MLSAIFAIFFMISFFRLFCLMLPFRCWLSCSMRQRLIFVMLTLIFAAAVAIAAMSFYFFFALMMLILPPLRQCFSLIFIYFFSDRLRHENSVVTVTSFIFRRCCYFICRVTTATVLCFHAAFAAGYMVAATLSRLFYGAPRHAATCAALSADAARAAAASCCRFSALPLYLCRRYALPPPCCHHAACRHAAAMLAYAFAADAA